MLFLLHEWNSQPLTNHIISINSDHFHFSLLPIAFATICLCCNLKVLDKVPGKSIVIEVAVVLIESNNSEFFWVHLCLLHRPTRGNYCGQPAVIRKFMVKPVTSKLPLNLFFSFPFLSMATKEISCSNTHFPWSVFLKSMSMHVWLLVLDRLGQPPFTPITWALGVSCSLAFVAIQKYSWKVDIILIEVSLLTGQWADNDKSMQK